MSIGSSITFTLFSPLLCVLPTPTPHYDYYDSFYPENTHTHTLKTKFSFCMMYECLRVCVCVCVLLMENKNHLKSAVHHHMIEEKRNECDDDGEREREKTMKWY